MLISAESCLCQSKRRALCGQRAALPASLSLPPPIHISSLVIKAEMGQLSLLLPVCCVAVSHAMYRYCCVSRCGMRDVKTGRDECCKLHKPGHTISPTSDFITAKSCVLELLRTLWAVKA